MGEALDRRQVHGDPIGQATRTAAGEAAGVLSSEDPEVKLG